MKLTCRALTQTLVKLAIRPLNYIRSKLKPSLAVNVQRWVRQIFNIYNRCKDCIFWEKVPPDNSRWAPLKEFSADSNKWGMCELASENKKIELGKPMAICMAEDIYDAEFMTIDDFGCSEFIGKK